jgi:hypothetical protein
VGVQEVRWDKGDTVGAGDYNLFYGKGNHQLGIGFLVHDRIISAVKKAEETLTHLLQCTLVQNDNNTFYTLDS